MTLKTTLRQAAHTPALQQQHSRIDSGSELSPNYWGRGKVGTAARLPGTPQLALGGLGCFGRQRQRDITLTTVPLSCLKSLRQAKSAG